MKERKRERKNRKYRKTERKKEEKVEADTFNSAYATNGHLPISTVSSSSASMGVSCSRSGSRRVSLCDEGAMPVTGSSLLFRCAIVQDGVMRRSEEESVEVTRIGMSRAVAID